jgi:hypothetical protein
VRSLTAGLHAEQSAWKKEKMSFSNDWTCHMQGGSPLRHAEVNVLARQDLFCAISEFTHWLLALSGIMRESLEIRVGAQFQSVISLASHDASALVQFGPYLNL